MKENLKLTYINTQNDFFEYHLFFKYWDCMDNKNNLIPQLKNQMIIMAVVSLLIVLIPVIDNSYLILSLAFVVLFLLRFCYEYFFGFMNDYNNMLRMYEELSKKRIVNVYDEKFTLEVSDNELSLTSDKTRRFCRWNDIEYIQETKNLIILSMKLSNEPHLVDFEPIKVAKRYILPEKIEAFRAIIEEKREQYHIAFLTDDETNPYIRKED